MHPYYGVEYLEKQNSNEWLTQQYFNVFHFRNNMVTSDVKTSGPVDFYYCKDIGLVHWNVAFSDTCWTLINYNLGKRSKSCKGDSIISKSHVVLCVFHFLSAYMGRL